MKGEKRRGQSVFPRAFFVFVTSANLTEAALDRNIELGLLVRDRTVAATTLVHFRTLIEKNLLQPLPPA